MKNVLFKFGLCNVKKRDKESILVWWLANINQSIELFY